MADKEVRTENVKVALITVAAQVAWSVAGGFSKAENQVSEFNKNFEEVYSSIVSATDGKIPRT